MKRQNSQGKGQPRGTKRHPRRKLRPNKVQLGMSFKDGKLDPYFIDKTIDVALGMMFVEALKKTGTREVVLKWLFPKDQGEGSDTTGKV